MKFTHSIVTCELPYLDPSDASDLCPRLFHLESTTGTFLSYEVLCPSKTPTFNCPFPVLQDDMYNVEQPGNSFTLIDFPVSVSNRSKDD